MNKMRNLISVLLGLLALAALAVGLAWLLGPQGVLPGQQVSPLPTPTPSLVETVTPEVIISIETPVRPFIPTPTLWPTPAPPRGPTPTPLPLRTPASDPAGRIFYRAYPLTDDRGFPIQAVDPIHAVEIDKRGEFVSEVDLRWNQSDPPRMYFDRMISSPDGRYLAGISSGESGETVFIVELTTGKFTLPDPGHVEVEGLMYGWHLNSREILFSTINAPDSGLWLVDVHTGEHRLVAQPQPPDGIQGAVISPDGRWVAYGYISGGTYLSPYEGVWLAESDGRNAVRLLERDAYVFSWSPDGRYFIYIGGGEEEVTHEDTAKIPMPAGQPLRLMDVRTGERRKLPVSFAFGYGHEPEWSPDGRSIAYVGFDGPEDKEAMRKNNPTRMFRNVGIYVVDIASGEIRRLASGIDPAWSPDSSMIAFASLVDGQADIWLINADGTGLRRVTDTPEIDWRPVWVGQ